GTLDRFPDLKICAAHGAGFLPSYANRSDAVLRVFPNRVGTPPKKKPTEYLRNGQILADTIMFTGEAVRHLVHEMGVDNVVMGTMRSMVEGRSATAQRAPDAFGDGGAGEIAGAGSSQWGERVADGVADRREAGHRTGFAAALDAKRVGGAAGRVETEREGGQV